MNESKAAAETGSAYDYLIRLCRYHRCPDIFMLICLPQRIAIIDLKSGKCLWLDDCMIAGHVSWTPGGERIGRINERSAGRRMGVMHSLICQASNKLVYDTRIFDSTCFPPTHSMPPSAFVHTTSDSVHNYIMAQPQGSSHKPFCPLSLYLGAQSLSWKGKAVTPCIDD